MSHHVTAAEIPFAKPADGGASRSAREFRRLDEDAYELRLPGIGVEFHANYLRRERHETWGELVVLCDLVGARVVHGTNILSRGTFNFSNPQARYQRARQLADLSKAPELDWDRLLEELCVSVLSDREIGEPPQLLRDIARPGQDDALVVDGLTLLKRHGVILFGDGGAAKSYIALYLAGRLAQRGVRVGLFDWELAGEDHRDRLERLFGADMPPIWYRRCRHPLSVEVDGLRRLAREKALDYIVYDSVGFASHEKAESAESALTYFRAAGQIGGGGLHIAHVTKAGDGADQRPFGSAYWHNSARSTFFMERSSESSDRDITIGMFNRKANLGRLQAPLAFRFEFMEDRTLVSRVDVGCVSDLAQKLPVWQRMKSELLNGARTLASLAETLGVPVDTLDRTVRRKRGLFVRVSGQDGIVRIGLQDGRAA